MGRIYKEKSISLMFSVGLPVLVFIISIAACMSLLAILDNANNEIFRAKENRAASTYAHEIESSISQSLDAAFDLRAGVRQNNGDIRGIDRLARLIMVSHGSVYSLSLAPVQGGFLGFPGSRSRFSRNLFHDQFPREVTQSNYSKFLENDISLKGVSELDDGNLVAIGVLPVYLFKGEDRIFWGVVSVTVALSRALQGFDGERLYSEGYEFEIWSRSGQEDGKISVLKSQGFSALAQDSITLGIPRTDLCLTLVRVGKKNNIKSWVGEIIALLFSCALSFISYIGVSLFKRKQELRRYALYDDLTGLPNRRLLVDRLQVAIRDAIRSKRKIAVSFIDLDGFKQINDNYGHAVGDKVLVEVSSRVQRFLRPSDTFARIGGDEFVLIINNLHHEQEADAVLQRIIDSAATPCTVVGQNVSVSSSIGTAFFDTHGRDVNSLLARADAAMYKAKSSGKNQLATAPPLLDDQC